MRGKLHATHRKLHSEKKITRNTQKATQREGNYTQHTESYTVRGKQRVPFSFTHAEIMCYVVYDQTQAGDYGYVNSIGGGSRKLKTGGGREGA